ncbi:hypothetical protein RRG08_043075 [Elysia crispata]|uniref:Uncharacterized protein n=1 Tax=Elysia crispata TaxID=231223 RepID=A0AAE0XYJ3_9GAST|nr:hypothetical protein RRG08_043075 [Elysia crispata]
MYVAHFETHSWKHEEQMDHLGVFSFENTAQYENGGKAAQEGSPRGTDRHRLHYHSALSLGMLAEVSSIGINGCSGHIFLDALLAPSGLYDITNQGRSAKLYPAHLPDLMNSSRK